MELKPCPFCGNVPKIEQKPLWDNGHGYYGCFKYVIQCHNCGCQIYMAGNDTANRDSETARTNAINAWNRRKEHDNVHT